MTCQPKCLWSWVFCFPVLLSQCRFVKIKPYIMGLEGKWETGKQTMFNWKPISKKEREMHLDNISSLLCCLFLIRFYGFKQILTYLYVANIFFQWCKRLSFGQSCSQLSSCWSFFQNNKWLYIDKHTQVKENSKKWITGWKMYSPDNASNIIKLYQNTPKVVLFAKGKAANIWC